MKNLILASLMSALVVTQSLAQEPSASGELTDEPQTLPAPSASELDPSLEENAPKTESVSTSAQEPATEVLKEESLPAETEPVTTVKKQSKDSVLSEEDLLKTSKPKDEDKVKSKKATESELFIQEAEKYKLQETFRNLRLNDVIEQGLRKNHEQNIKEQKNLLNEIQLQSAKNAFWLPALKINLTTASQKISTLHAGATPPLSSTPTTPAGALSLSLGDYTVFNWGKDYALYLNKKEGFERSRQTLDEARRELKLQLIGKFFQLVAVKNVEKIRQDQLRQASFIYRLSKEKITVGKISKQDYYLARSEYLKAQSDYHASKLDSDNTDESMSFLIADEVGTKYITSEMLEYKPIKVGIDEVIGSAKLKNPTLLNDKVAIDQTQRSYDVAQKENLPLPKFSINLGAYTKNFSSTSNQTTYETYGGSGNVELVALINASWSLTGEDGFLNGNKLALSRLEKEIANREFEKDHHSTLSQVRQTYKSIMSLQNQMVILDARLSSLKRSFDTVLENYLSGKTKFNDFHLSLMDLTDTKILYEQIKLNHLLEKLNLAKLAGLEDFPGENFEQLAAQVKGK